jgi:hypothetical protein
MAEAMLRPNGRATFGETITVFLAFIILVKLNNTVWVAPLGRFEKVVTLS